MTKSNSNPLKLKELLRELDGLLQTGVVTKDEYDCLKFILNHAYTESVSNQIKQELSISSKYNCN
jgi:hypothetical protein